MAANGLRARGTEGRHPATGEATVTGVGTLQNRRAVVAVAVELGIGLAFLALTAVVFVLVWRRGRAEHRQWQEHRSRRERAEDTQRSLSDRKW